MKTIKCDRCGQEPEDGEIGYWGCIELGTIDVEWDICPECIEALAHWIATPPKKKEMK